LAGLVTPAAGCGDEAPASPVGTPARIVHTFPGFRIAPGDNVYVCQSWTLGNETELWVNAVFMESQGGFHHANLLFVPDDRYDGPDGTWDCDERLYDEVVAGASGGVFFAMSTQAETDRQQFPPGAAYRIPPRSRVLGGVHLLNTTERTFDTAMTVRAELLPAERVTTHLQELYITNTALRIPGRATSSFGTTCELGTQYRRIARRPDGFDFRIYYVLPHFHELASGFRLELAGGTRDGEAVFDVSSGIGDPLGKTYETPFEVRGAEGFRLTCVYDNPGDDVVRYGADREDEMCVVLAYTDAPVKLLGTSSGDSVAGAPDEGGVVPHDVGCTALALRPAND
jgi:hypothetical protein